MTVFTMKNSRTTVIRISDDTSPDEIHAIEKKLRPTGSGDEILIDLAGLNYLNGAIIDFLTGIKNSPHFIHNRFAILNPNETVLRMLQMRHFDQSYKIQNIYPTAW
jgi:anti-anti-sigma regulatory factor